MSWLARLVSTNPTFTWWSKALNIYGWSTLQILALECCRTGDLPIMCDSLLQKNFSGWKEPTLRVMLSICWFSHNAENMHQPSTTYWAHMRTSEKFLDWRMVVGIIQMWLAILQCSSSWLTNPDDNTWIFRSMALCDQKDGTGPRQGYLNMPNSPVLDTKESVRVMRQNWSKFLRILVEIQRIEEGDEALDLPRW